LALVGSGLGIFGLKKVAGNYRAVTYASESMSPTLTNPTSPLVVQRVLEWSLYREITIGLPWTAETLVAASDWLQRKVSEDSSSPEALAVLATSGHTRRIRNATFGRN
jgi:hypothetical protein